VTVEGLESTPFLNKVPSTSEAPAANAPIAFTQETDRVYMNTAQRITTVLQDRKPVFEVKRDEGLTDVVVWNPWPEKAGGMSDFGPSDGWKRMVCVEAGKVAEWTKVEGGESWEGGQRMRRVD
jgi:glucose-6-phosphate 1-epimerase